MTGTAGPELGSRTVALAEVKTLLAQVSSSGQEDDVHLVIVAGDTVQIIDLQRNARQAPPWLKKVILDRLAKRGSGGVEQA